MSQHADVTAAFRTVIESDAGSSVAFAEIEPRVTGVSSREDDAALRGVGYFEFASYLQSLNRFVKQRLKDFDVVLEKSWLLSGLVSWLCRRQGIAAIPVENYVPSPRQGSRQDALSFLRLGLGRSIAGICLRRAPLLIAETDQLKRSIARRWRIDVDRIEVVGLGVDRDAFHPMDRAAARRELEIQADVTTLIYVGVLDLAHDLEPAIRALGEVEDRNVDLHIIGDGTLRDRFKYLVRSFPDRVIFHGRLPHRMVPKFIAAADLCLAPYDPEWFPGREVAYSTLKIREYLSSGRPVVSVPSGSIEDLIIDGVNGFLIDNSLDGWRRLLTDLPDREVLNRMGEAARKSPIPDWEDVALRYLAVCERAVLQMQSGG